VKFAVPTIANGKVYIGTTSTITAYGLLHDPTPLVVTVSGSGSITSSFSGTTQRITGNPYTIQAMPAPGNVFNGWTDVNTSRVISRSPKFTFTMSENLCLEADFVPNPFPAVAGNYSGLSLGYPPARETDGLASFTVGANGTLTGSIFFEGKAYALLGAFWNDGTFSKTIRRPGLPSINIALQIDVTHNTNQITGSISDNLFSAGFSADRALASTGTPAKYTLVFPHAAPAMPQGDGFGSVSVDESGHIRFAGVLGDGTPVSQGARLSKNGTWPFLVTPYRNHGSAAGVLTFEAQPSSDIDGTIYWFNAGNISTVIAAVGSHYDSLANPLLGFSGPVTFSAQDGDLNPSPVTKTFTLDASNHIGPGPGTAGLTLTFKLDTGLLTGSFIDSSSNSHLFKGVVFQKTSTASGVFKSGQTTGSISLHP